MKKLILAIAFSVPMFASAQQPDYASFEACSYDLSKDFLKIVNETVKLRSSQQVQAMLDGVGYFCKEHYKLAQKEGLDDAAAALVVKRSFGQALVESMLAPPSPPYK